MSKGGCLIKEVQPCSPCPFTYAICARNYGEWNQGSSMSPRGDGAHVLYFIKKNQKKKNRWDKKIPSFKTPGAIQSKTKT